MTSTTAAGADPLIPPITPGGATALAEELAKTTAPGKPVNNLFLTLAHHPALMKRHNVLGGAFRHRSVLDPVVREVVTLRVAARSRSSYEFARHTMIAMALGMETPRIRAIAVHARRPGTPAEPDLTPLDRILIEATDMLMADDRIGPETLAELAREFGVPAVLELITLVGFYRMTAGILNTAATPLEDDVPEDVVVLATELTTTEPAPSAMVLLPAGEQWTACVNFWSAALATSPAVSDGRAWAMFDTLGLRLAVVAGDADVAAASVAVKVVADPADWLPDGVVAEATRGGHEVRWTTTDPAGNAVVLYRPLSAGAAG